MCSRDTTENFIADLAVGTDTEIIKFGALILVERIEKIGRPCYMEHKLGDSAKLADASVSQCEVIDEARRKKTCREYR